MAIPDTYQPRPLPKSGAGTQITRGNIYDVTETNSDIEGEKWYGSPYRAGIADAMLKDAHVRMSLEYITSPLRAASWVFEPGGDSDKEKEAADFCNWNFFERLSWDRFLRELLTCKSHGFSMFEVTDDIERVPGGRFKALPGDGTAVVITGLHHRPAYTTHGWIQSKRNPTQLEAWEQWIISSDGEQGGIRRIESDRLLRFTENQTGAVFHGVPALRSAYGPWRIKNTLTVIEAIAHERNHGGLPTIRLPEGASDEDIDYAESTLAAMNANEKGFVILPHGFEFKWETVNGQATPINTSIETQNRDIAFNVGAGFMLLGLQGGSGSYALAQSQQGQFQLQLDVTSKTICGTFNRGSDGWSPLKRLTEMNFGADVAPPRLTVRNMPTRDWQKALPVLNQLALSGLVIADDSTEEFIRDVMQLPKADEESLRRGLGIRNRLQSDKSLDAVEGEDE